MVIHHHVLLLKTVLHLVAASVFPARNMMLVVKITNVNVSVSSMTRSLSCARLIDGVILSLKKREYYTLNFQKMKMNYHMKSRVA